MHTHMMSSNFLICVYICVCVYECILIHPLICDFPGGASGKESTCPCRRLKRCEFDLWVGKIPGGGHGSPL